MKAVIFGLGHVGKAYYDYLKDNHDVYVVEPKLHQEYINDNYDLALICVNTPLNENTNRLDTTAVKSCIKTILDKNRNIDIVIKSTLPIGETEKLISEFDYERIFVSPEFLKEKSALEDIKNPSRIVMGTINKSLKGINKYLSCFSCKNIIVTSPKEAEAIKLFSNAYLATRLSFFNELDSLAQEIGFDSHQVIEGMGYDPRIGNTYNQVSDGWGGSCLPKDTQELASLLKEHDLNLLDEVIISNKKRKSKNNK